MLRRYPVLRQEGTSLHGDIRVGPIVRAISQACVLVCILSFTSGCREYSKEQQREIDVIKRRVTENPASIDHDDGHGTPLEVATLNGYLDLAQWLVSHRADVNAPDLTKEQYSITQPWWTTAPNWTFCDSCYPRVRMWTRDVRGPRRHCMLPFSSGGPMW
jgi:hypothetical protein